MKQSEELFTVREDVVCLECGNKGAIQHYARYYPNGIREKADGITSLEKYRNRPYMSRAMGFGGTIPHRCMNCGNVGLIDFGGLEGYKEAFRSIKEEK